MYWTKLFLFIAGMAFIMTSCQKETILEIPENNETRKRITISEARNWYEQHREFMGRNDDDITSLNVQPDWLKAKTIKYTDTENILVVPILDKIEFSMPEIKDESVFHRLVFFYSGDNSNTGLGSTSTSSSNENNIVSRVLTFVPTSEYAERGMNNYSVDNFSGITYQINEVGAVGNAGLVKEGSLYKLNFEANFGSEEVDSRDPGRGCPGWGQSLWDEIKDGWKDFIGWIGDGIGDIFGWLGGEDGSLNPNWTIPEGTISATNNWSAFFGIGSSSSTDLNDFFEDELFNQAPTETYLNECNFTIGDDMPFALAAGSEYFREGWLGNFHHGFYFYLNEINQGNTDITFSETLMQAGEVYDNPDFELTFLDVGLRDDFKEAANKVFVNMVNQYETCYNSSTAQVDYEGEWFFDFNQEDFCDCIATYSVADAQEDLLANYLGISAQEASFLEEHPEILVSILGTDRKVFEFNPNLIAEIKDFVENNDLEYEESANEAVQMYLNIISDEDLLEFAGEFSGIPAFLWPFIQEIALELAVELFKRNFPGVNQIDDIRDAVLALQQGDLLGLCGEIIDIVKDTAKNLNLPLKAINVVWDGVDLGVQASRAWKAIMRLEQFGATFIDKLLDVIDEKAGGILGKIQWKGHPIGATMPSSVNALDFLEDLADLFGKTLDYSNASIGQYQFYPDCCGITLIRIYYDSNTTGPNYYTLWIKAQFGEDFKIRFTD